MRNELEGTRGNRLIQMETWAMKKEKKKKQILKARGMERAWLNKEMDGYLQDRFMEYWTNAQTLQSLLKVFEKKTLCRHPAVLTLIYSKK